MLVITRKPGEKIQIGDDITICVIKYERGQVRIGIDAPIKYRITRIDNKKKEDENVKKIK